MTQSPATATTTFKQNGFTRKPHDMNNHFSSSPRRTAIGKQSLRLSIPTIEQIADAKTLTKLNHNDTDNRKTDSFVKRMIDNCNHSGQLPSNIENNNVCNDSQVSNSENPADVCDTNRVKSVIEKLDKNKRMNNSNSSNGGGGINTSIGNSTNDKSPTDITMATVFDADMKSMRKPSIEIFSENDKLIKDNDIDSNGSQQQQQIDNFLSYAKFEDDFKKRINEMNANRLDAQTHGIYIHIYFIHFHNILVTLTVEKFKIQFFQKMLYNLQQNLANLE